MNLCRTDPLKIAITMARYSDVDEIAILLESVKEDCFFILGEKNNLRDWVHKVVMQEGGVIARSEGVLVGCALGYVNKPNLTGRLSILAFGSRWWRVGLAPRLVSSFEEWCFAEGMISVCLDTNESNAKAIAIFQGLGYSVLERGIGSCDIRLGKTLKATFLTPIQKLDHFSGSNEIWMKRDDLLPFSFGGNKVRIANELIADMLSKRCDHMVAYGGSRSNFIRAISNLCSAQGVPCTVVVTEELPSRRSMNLALAESFGAEIIRCGRESVRETLERVLVSLRESGSKPYYVFGDETGVGNEAAQCIAYVKTYAEILRQEAVLGHSFDVIAHASGTGMTQAGLVCGQEVLGGNHRIIGLSIARSRETGIPPIRRRVSAFLTKAGIDPTKALSLIEFRDEWTSGGYASVDQGVIEISERLMALEGVPTDHTYVGKSFHALLELLAREQRSGLRVLFIHTGGTPLFFDAA